MSLKSVKMLKNKMLTKEHLLQMRYANHNGREGDWVEHSIILSGGQGKFLTHIFLFI